LIGLVTTDFPCSMKTTPVIDMAPNTTADMVNADSVHNIRLDALCSILVLFEYTVDRFTNEMQSIYDQVTNLKSMVSLLAKQRTTLK